jgi:hypothetical protein
MMVEFEDHDDYGRELLLDYIRQHPPTPCSACRGRGCEVCSHTGLAEFMARQAPSPEPSQPGCLWRLVGRLNLGCLRWRYGRRS